MWSPVEKTPPFESGEVPVTIISHNYTLSQASCYEHSTTTNESVNHTTSKLIILIAHPAHQLEVSCMRSSLRVCTLVLFILPVLDYGICSLSPTYLPK